MPSDSPRFSRSVITCSTVVSLMIPFRKARISCVSSKFTHFRQLARARPEANDRGADLRNPPLLVPDERFACLALGVQRVEVIFQTFFRRFSSIDGARPHGGASSLDC